MTASLYPGKKGYFVLYEMVLLSFDYSQIELRFLAHLCKDDALRDAFANDEDIHARVAAGLECLGCSGEFRDHRYC